MVFPCFLPEFSLAFFFLSFASDNCDIMQMSHCQTSKQVNPAEHTLCEEYLYAPGLIVAETHAFELFHFMPPLHITRDMRVIMWK